MPNKLPKGGVYTKPLGSRWSNSMQISYEKTIRNRQEQEQYPLGIESQTYQTINAQQYTATPFRRVHLQQESNIELMDRPTEQENLIYMEQHRQKRMRKSHVKSLPISIPAQPLTSRIPINPETKNTFGDLELDVSINRTASRRFSNCEEQISKMLKLESNTFEEETMQIENLCLSNEGTQIYLNNKDNQSADYLNKSSIPKDSAILNDNDEEPMDIDMDENLNIPVSPKLPVMEDTIPFFANTKLLKTLPRSTQPLCEFLNVIPLTSPIDLILKMRQHEMQFLYEKKEVQTSEKRNLSLIEGYPKVIGSGFKREYILGPNGTKISFAQYNQVRWTSPLVATCNLLNILFSDKELATQTPSSKLSAVIYNHRESLPEKSQLDSARIEDIIVCVLNVAGGSEQYIRAVIIKKCIIMSRKYKHAKKIEHRIKKKLEEDSIQMAYDADTE